MLLLRCVWNTATLTHRIRASLSLSLRRSQWKRATANCQRNNIHHAIYHEIVILFTFCLRFFLSFSNWNTMATSCSRPLDRRDASCVVRDMEFHMCVYGAFKMHQTIASSASVCCRLLIVGWVPCFFEICQLLY